LEVPPLIAALPHWTPSAVVCASLLLIATLMMRGHRRGWARRHSEELSDPADLLHYHASTGGGCSRRF